jgi:hypothetical protein
MTTHPSRGSRECTSSGGEDRVALQLHYVDLEYGH